jgi:hypothetical protein
MNGIDPKWVFYLGILVTIQTAIGQGAVTLTNVFPELWIPYIKGWSQFLGFIGTTIMTALSGFSSKSSGPLVKPIVLVAVILGSLFVFTGDARAQSPKPLKLTGNLVDDIKNAGRSDGSPRLLPDLQYAKKLADASGSKVTSPCYGAWIDIINTRQKAVTDDAGNPIDLPTPHLVTDFEKMVELRNALQPESEFMIKCSPVASMVKKDILGFIGVVIGGGAGLATLVPGL